MIKEFYKILKEGTSDSRKEWFNVSAYEIDGDNIRITY